jgi:HPt (histidine-containing phosphotransfer) domain-containing protein
MPETDVIDTQVFETLLQSVGGDKEFLAELLETFYDDAPQQLDTARQALDEDNAEALRRAAHSLKSNSATFGAKTLSVCCKELEDMGKAGALDGAGAQIEEVAAEYSRARSALEALQRDA